MPISPRSFVRRDNPMTFIGGFALQPNGGAMGLSGSQLQSTISAATSGIGTLPEGTPHHPITCTDKLYYDEHGEFSCEHGSVPPNDERTRAGVIHSLVILLIEEGLNFTGMKELPYERATTTKND